jgi:hypothetical protein
MTRQTVIRLGLVAAILLIIGSSRPRTLIDTPSLGRLQAA